VRATQRLLAGLAPAAIAQAVNELRLEQIWQLRNSAAHYRPGAAS
jgi:hypothetical protein